ADAMIRVAYRRLFSRHHLLQWNSNNNHSLEAHQRFLVRLGGVSLFGLAVLVPTTILDGKSIQIAFCLLWGIAPWIAYMIDKPLERRSDEKISPEERKMLRKIARKTWRYFDDFVGPQTHWLPPDNYQTALTVEIAQRTSPTNIGMWLLAAMSAYDLKYITG